MRPEGWKLPGVESGNKGKSANLRKIRTATSRKPMTAGLIPCKMDLTASEELNLFREPATSRMRMKEGILTPRVATSEPKKEARGLLSQTRAPTKVAALTAIGPGVICEIVATWANSAGVSQLRLIISC